MSWAKVVTSLVMAAAPAYCSVALLPAVSLLDETKT
jgi:hypothetical protein